MQLVAIAYLSGGATAYLGGCHYLSGGSHSDDKASLSSSQTVLELSTGTELGNNNIRTLLGTVIFSILAYITQGSPVLSTIVL